jgi:hypothetical protein
MKNKYEKPVKYIMKNIWKIYVSTVSNICSRSIKHSKTLDEKTIPYYLVIEFFMFKKMLFLYNKMM